MHTQSPWFSEGKLWSNTWIKWTTITTLCCVCRALLLSQNVMRNKIVWSLICIMLFVKFEASCAKRETANTLATCAFKSFRHKPLRLSTPLYCHLVASCLKARGKEFSNSIRKITVICINWSLRVPIAQSGHVVTDANPIEAGAAACSFPIGLWKTMLKLADSLLYLTGHWSNADGISCGEKLCRIVAVILIMQSNLFIALCDESSIAFWEIIHLVCDPL